MSLDADIREGTLDLRAHSIVRDADRVCYFSWCMAKKFSISIGKVKGIDNVLWLIRTPKTIRPDFYNPEHFLPLFLIRTLLCNSNMFCFSVCGAFYNAD